MLLATMTSSGKVELRREGDLTAEERATLSFIHEKHRVARGIWIIRNPNLYSNISIIAKAIEDGKKQLTLEI